MDPWSDSFLETNVPLLELIETAKGGHEKEVKEAAQVVWEHASKFSEVINLACCISNNEEYIQVVQTSVSLLETLSPEDSNAALAVEAKAESELSQEYVDLLKEEWEKPVHVLTECVNDVISTDDFLPVSESHILEYMNRCVIVPHENDMDGLYHRAVTI